MKETKAPLAVSSTRDQVYFEISHIHPSGVSLDDRAWGQLLRDRFRELNVDYVPTEIPGLVREVEQMLRKASDRVGQGNRLSTGTEFQLARQRMLLRHGLPTD